MLNRMKWLALIIIFLSVASCGPNKSITGPESQKIVANVEGTKITEKDLAGVIKTQAPRLEMELYQVKRDGINKLIEKLLIEQEAEKDGKTPEAYLNEYLAENMKEPTDEEIEEFYRFKKKESGFKDSEKAKKHVAEFLRLSRKQAARKRLIKELNRKALVDISLERPRIEVGVGNSLIKGPKDAPITIIEFSDYESLSSSKVRKVIKKIMKAYPREIRYVFKDYPLHPPRNKPPIHEVAHCAGDQGKYWKMHEILFDNQRALSAPFLRGYTRRVGLDLDKLDKCLEEGTHSETVSKSINEGNTLGISKSPTFFVNGLFIPEPPSFGDLRKIIEAELEKKKR